MIELLNRFAMRIEVGTVELRVLKPCEDPPSKTTRDARAHKTSPDRYPVIIELSWTIHCGADAASLFCRLFCSLFLRFDKNGCAARKVNEPHRRLMELFRRKSRMP